METAKREFIKSLIETAQESIWKNELAKDFALQFSEDKDKDVKIKACDHAIEKDKEYIAFLKEHENNIQKTPTISPTTGTI